MYLGPTIDQCDKLHLHSTHYPVIILPIPLMAPYLWFIDQMTCSHFHPCFMWLCGRLAALLAHYSNGLVVSFGWDE